MNKRWLRPLTAGLLGLLTALIAAEIVLRLVGGAHDYGGRSATGGTKAILCVGDSFTEGVGASSSLTSYPAQLENLLKKNGKPYAVTNIGKTRANSSQVVRMLGQALRQNTPEAAIIMCGSANIWNLRDAWQLNAGPFRNWLRNRLFSLSICKFYAYARESRLARRAGEQNKTGSSAPPERGALAQARQAENKLDFEQARRLYHEALKQTPSDGALWAGLAGTYFAQEKNSEALLAALDGLKTAGSARHLLHYRVGQYFYTQWDTPYRDANYLSSAYWLEKAVREAVSAGDAGNADKILWELLYCYRQTDDAQRGKAFLNSLTLDGEKKSVAEDFLKTRNLDPKILDWLAHDLREMTELCRSKGVKPFIANFPDHKVYSGINRRIRAVAAELEVPLIDNAAFFASLEKEHPGSTNTLLDADGLHFNDAGYALMAENVYRVLSASGLN